MRAILVALLATTWTTPRTFRFVAVHGGHVAFYLRRGPGYRGERQPVIFVTDNILYADGQRPDRLSIPLCPFDGSVLHIDGRHNFVIVDRRTGDRWEPGRPLPKRPAR